MSRRVVLGQQSDGSFGLRCSAAGFDAFTATDDGQAITFDSRWTDIAKMTALGIATEQLVTLPGGTDPFWRPYATYPDLGYKPFVEARKIAGNVVFDDFLNGTNIAGSYTIIDTNALYGGGASPSPTGTQMLFIVYQIPVPSG